MSVDSTELSASAVSVSLSLIEIHDLESRESVEMGFDFDAVEDSPYLEVHVSASNVDDPEMPALLFRMWVIGLVLCMIGSGLNVFLGHPARTRTRFVPHRKTRDVFAADNHILIANTYSLAGATWSTRLEGNRVQLLAQSWSVKHQGACVGVHHGKHRSREPVST